MSNITKLVKTKAVLATLAHKLCSVGSTIMGLLKLGFLLAVGLVLFGFLDQIKHKGYIFDQHVLHRVATEAIAQNYTKTEQLISHIVSGLDKEYPGHINKVQEWLFNNAGGAMGAMYLIHASLTEYVIIFGTPIGTGKQMLQQ